MSEEQQKKKTITGGLVLTLTWVVIMFLPLMFVNFTQGFSIECCLVEMVIPFSLFIVFYTNFLYLAPRILMKGHSGKFFFLNVMMIIGIAILMNEWLIFARGTWFKELLENVSTPPSFRERWPMFYICRDIFNMSVSATVATAIVLSRNWSIMANRQATIEKERMQMEVKMLKYQMNPHFLLNALNNIYALTRFDQEKAQEAIQQLSSILRHVLYDSETELVSLSDEITFIENYISLMELRTPQNVAVTQRIDIQKAEEARIAPLLIIPLIENAFKHGVSSERASFIDIRITASNECIECDITNSNFPKSQSDYSGSGIGLQQVQRRLDLHYPNKYEWTYGPSDDNQMYHSKIKLYDTKLYRH